MCVYLCAGSYKFKICTLHAYYYYYMVLFFFFRGCRGAVYIKTPRKRVKCVCRKRPTFLYTYVNICMYIIRYIYILYICIQYSIYIHKRRTLLRKWVRNASVIQCDTYACIICVYPYNYYYPARWFREKRVFERAFCHGRYIVFKQHLFVQIIINDMRHIVGQQ